jgi:pyruvate ferredoxin oxidoreductase gamma subunit
VQSPDLIAIADASLLEDPLVRPLEGLLSSGTILVNATQSMDSIAAQRAYVHDFTGLALHHTDSASALSVALGVGAARLAGLDRPFIERAVLDELHQLKLDAARIEKNLELARACFDELPASATQPRVLPSVHAEITSVITPVYKGSWTGTASVASSPNTALRKTGDWRVMRPLIDADRCTRCWVCFVNCPDGAITLGPSDLPWIDYGVCKGCLICAEECPIDAIATVREAHYEA